MRSPDTGCIVVVRPKFRCLTRHFREMTICRKTQFAFVIISACSIEAFLRATTEKIMKGYFPLLFCALCFFFGCGGGSNGALNVGASPTVTLTPTTLAFGIQDLNTTSQPLSLTLANSGTNVLQIATITASGNFQQSTTCGTQLAGRSELRCYRGFSLPMLRVP